MGSGRAAAAGGSGSAAPAVMVRVSGGRLNLQLAAGELCVIFGREDAGTSELLRGIVGHSRIADTRIEVLGMALGALRPGDMVALRRRIGYVFRETGLLSNMTLEENVALPVRYHTSLSGPAIAERVHALLDRFGLTEVRHHRPADVDHFIRKRAAFARALTLDPDILLADYPLEGLDPVGAARMAEIMTEVAERPGRLFVVATCELGPYASLDGRFLMFEGGELLWQGHRGELAAVTHAAVRQFLDRSTAGPLATF